MGGVRTTVLFLAVFWMVALISNAQAQTTVVVYANPLWTDTGLVLASGDQVSITASGSWSWGIIGSTRIFVGPEGGGSSFDVFQRFDDNALGRLIGFVGSDPW